MKCIDNVLGQDGVYRPSLPLPEDLHMSMANGPRTLCYSFPDMIRKQGHEHWVMTHYKNAQMNSEYIPIMDNPRVKGVVYLTDWRLIETSEGVYDTAPLVSILDYMHARGKKVIFRCLAKTYAGTVTDPVGALPQTLAIPDYIVLDHATYGGDPYRGGIHKVFLIENSVYVHKGWGAQFENSAVLNKWNAMVTAVGAVIKTHPAFKGWIGPDESTRSALSGSGLPPGVTLATVTAANKAIWQHDVEVYGSGRVWPVINYLDTTGPNAEAIQSVIDLQSWAVQNGMNVAVSDTYILPDRFSQFTQPVYYSTPRQDLQQGRATLVHVDYLSLFTPSGYTMNERMRKCALQTYRLGADITVWNPWPPDPSVWPAQQLAIDATA